MSDNKNTTSDTDHDDQPQSQNADSSKTKPTTYQEDTFYSLSDKQSIDMEGDDDDDDDDDENDCGEFQRSMKHEKFCLSDREIDFDKLVRPKSQAAPRNFLSRIIQTFKQCFRTRQQDDVKQSQQYRIPPDKTVFSYVSVARNAAERTIVKFTSWCYQTNWLNLMVTFLVLYLLGVLFFSLLLSAISQRYYDARGGKECIDGWDHEVENPFRSNFEVAFDLSWTTYSTVGYGTISPNVTRDCFGVRFICAMEAFVGVLYSGFCGAILYSKVVRLQASAHVKFSSTMCVQYGEGISASPSIVGGTVLSSIVGGLDLDSGKKHVPFPVLEFRIVNERCNMEVGGIIDASIDCYLIMSKPGSILHESTTRTASARFGNVIQHSPAGVREKIPLAKNFFQKLQLETDKHPFFKNAWYARHVLDGSSPLLKRKIKREIVRNDGSWPSRINDHESVRDSIVKFQDIAVAFNGTSEVNVNDVFAQYRYRYEDLYIGWQFAGIFYAPTKKKRFRHDDSDVRVDMDLIHDILPQIGGGNEPLGSSGMRKSFSFNKVR